VRAAGAAVIGAALVAGVVALSTRAEAAPDDGVDFDVDAELQLAQNYYANAITNPVSWSAGQLVSLEGYLQELGLTDMAVNIHDMRTGIYGDAIPTPEPLPSIQFIPQSEIDAIADSLENETDS
jgi:hypothetical protein